MTTKKFQTPTTEEIANYAYSLWEKEGRNNGRELDYWLQAETHLTNALEHAPELRQPTPTASSAITEKNSQPATANAAAFTTKPSRQRQNRPARGRAYN